ATTDATDSSKEEIGTVPTLAQIQESGKLVVATNATFPPFEYIFENQPVGVDIDVTNEIATQLGVQTEILDLEFASIIESVKTGKANLAIAGITKNEERLQQVDMSDEYITSAQYLITTKDSTLTSENLEGAIIGVQEGTTGDFYATDETKAKEVKRYSAIAAAANDLMNGRIDAVIIDKLPADNIIAITKGQLKIEEKALTEESYAIVVAKGNTELLEAINSVIAKLKEEGKIDQFLTEHIEKSALQ
ncbi:MAG: ABC transporter substrate-binding protein, partial [Oscillospiraceae bacterium]